MPLQPENDASSEEAVLLAQIAAGDREAFRRLYARYSGPLFSLAVRFVSDPGAAEELLQDAFLKIWCHAVSYDSRRSRPFTWAVTIMRRTCIDHLRRRRLAPAVVPLSVAATADHPGGDAVRRTVEAREDAGRLGEALAAIPPERRQAIELALFSGMTHTEIARHLNQPAGTVKSWIRRGMLDLRTTLAEPAP